KLMLYPDWLKEQAAKLAREEQRSAEQIADIFEKEADQRKHDYRPTPRTIRNWSKEAERRQSSSTTQQSDLARRHDLTIFENSDSIWEEREILGFLSRLYSDHHHIINDAEFGKLGEYSDFFTYEGNQYIQSRLRDLSRHLSEAIADLVNFVGREFSHHRETQAKLHPGLRDPWDYRRPQNHWNSDRKRYMKYEQHLKNLIDVVEKAYKAYRAEVRETLFG
ncbi:MAG: hypothetical protein ACW97O_17945, partial [Candidatus Thorarchaeota archaeon]